jgi:hypothetical protein
MGIEIAFLLDAHEQASAPVRTIAATTQSKNESKVNEKEGCH